MSNLLVRVVANSSQECPRLQIRMMNRLRSCSAAALMLFTLVQPCGAELKVEGRPRWGFDGTIRVNDFNLLTVTVFNDSENPWQGDLSLQPEIGAMRAVDMPVIQPGLFIEPYGTRDIQFHPFIVDPIEFRVRWTEINSQTGRPVSRGSLVLDAPDASYGELSIQLTGENSGNRSREHLPFNELDFPGTATVLRPVTTIVLDHVPAWQNPQFQAFRDWLYGGGTVYLISDAQGETLQFPSVLDELNEPSDQFPVGYGRVFRAPTPPPRDKASRSEKVATNSYQLSSARTLFALMRAMTTPDHNWGLIYLMATFYLLILFPGCWILGWKKGDFRLTYAVILGTVALFSFGFHAVGKRGYGERTTVNSVAIARPGQPGRWVVKQWSNLFITSGGQYTITHELDSKAVSTGKQDEAAAGFLVNQPNGMMLADIPSFSNRTVAHAGVLKSEGIRPIVDQLVVNETTANDGTSMAVLESLELSLPEGQSWSQFTWMYAAYRGTLYELGQDGNRIVKRRTFRPLESALSEQATSYQPMRWDYEEPETPPQLYAKTFWSLMLDDLGVFEQDAIGPRSRADSRVRVYLFSEMTPEFFATGDLSEQQHGRVLYVFHLHPDSDTR